MRTDRIDTVWDEELDPDFHNYVVVTARAVLREEQRKGFDPKPKTIVDRRHNAPIESVKMFGLIEFIERTDLGEIVDWIYRRLVETSPVLKGDYAANHLILMNGEEASERDWKSFGPGDRLTFVNTMPYARRIEGGARFMGWNSRVDRSVRNFVGGHSVQAPNGVYRVVFRQAKNRFGKQVIIEFRYVVLTGGTVKTPKFRTDATRSRFKGYRYPALQLYVPRT